MTERILIDRWWVDYCIYTCFNNSYSGKYLLNL